MQNPPRLKEAVLPGIDNTTTSAITRPGFPGRVFCRLACRRRNLCVFPLFLCINIDILIEKLYNSLNISILREYRF